MKQFRVQQIIKWFCLTRDGILTDTFTPGQSGPSCNNSAEVLPIPQSFRIGVSPSDGLVSTRTLVRGTVDFGTRVL